MFTAIIDPPIEEGRKIILPVSMNQSLESGSYLRAIIEFLKDAKHQENTTILVCDYLNRHNIGEEAAMQQGEVFLKTHKELLEGFKIIRWKDFMELKKELFEIKNSEIKEKSKEGSKFFDKIKRTWSNCLKAQDFENSVKYQQEEYAVTLCMTEYDDNIYPQKISPGLGYLYGHFQDKKPHYHPIHFKKVTNSLSGNDCIHEKSISNDTYEIDLHTNLNHSFFSNKTPKHHNSLPFALRLVLNQMEQVLKSSEISTASKLLFVDQIESLISITIGNEELVPTKVAFQFNNNAH